MALQGRQKPESSTNKFLDLIADPFQAQIQENSIYAAIIYSFAISTLLVVVFCFLRPRNARVYAPRAKHADEKHRPIELGSKPWSWLTAVKDVKEQDLVAMVGLDAVVFLRFLRMLRNIFAILAVVGCAILIPVNVAGGSPFYQQWHNIPTLMKFTPQYIYGQKFWAFVLVAYIIQGTVCFFLWWNYRAVLKLKRAYFDSHEYKASLQSRSLLLTHIPKSSRTELGLVELVEQVKRTSDHPRTAIGRNVKDLPKLIKAHDEAVRDLEKHLADYLRNPNQLPTKRPTCKVAKDDVATSGKGKVDAIDYLTDRISRLKTTIEEIRETVDMRNPMPYGFASYTHIEDAHAVAYASRNKGPAGCDVYLAPKPHDLLWQNLPMSREKRRMRAFWDGLWVVLFTIAFIIPNILTAAFLSDFSHLALVWPAFKTDLAAHPKGWAVVQGILAPLVQTLLYMGVPVVFRRLFTHSGDVSKTSRERHVTARLYSFFVFNNLLVFSIFGSAWRFVTAVIAAKDQGVWEAMKGGHLFAKIMTGLCSVSTFWLTWQMQRTLGAAIDLSQAWIFLWSSIQRKFFSPTPRQLIELSAPQPFPYADYYNNYLFVATVGMCMGTLQPIILPVTVLYLAADYAFKKYLLQYVFITKTESGGRFWRLLVNRMLFAVLLANAVIALVVGAQGVGSINAVQNGNMLYAMVPLPFLLFGFKWYCKKAFDDKLLYYSTISFSDAEGFHSPGHAKEKTNQKVNNRYGHPALYQTLLTPMVHAKSQHLLGEIYGNGSSNNIFEVSNARSATRGYGDMYLTEMSHDQPGKRGSAEVGIPHLEIVNESELDFENFKKRAEFRDQFGGEGELYGKSDDLSSRPGTPSTLTSAKPMSPVKRKAVPGSPLSSPRHFDEIEYSDQGTSYPQGYQNPPSRMDDEFQRVSLDTSIPVTPLSTEQVFRPSSSRQPLVASPSRDGNERAGYFDRASGYDDGSYERYRNV